MMDRGLDIMSLVIQQLILIMQEEIQLRDITIIYRDLKVHTKVEMNKIVSEFFKHRLRDFSDRFKAQADASKVPSFIPLSELKLYDVTLNTTNQGENTVLNNAGVSFGAYDKKKNLRFYIHDLQSNKGGEGDNEKSNIIDREQSVDISEMRFGEFESKMREIFAIDPTMQIKYKNLKDNTFINFSEVSGKPIKIINQLRITKVGVYPVYEAGGSE